MKKRILSEDQIGEIFEALLYGGRQVKQKTLAHTYGVSAFVIQEIYGIIRDALHETKGWTNGGWNG